MEDQRVLAKGLCERIGIEGGRVIHKLDGRDKYQAMVDMPTHSAAMKVVSDLLTGHETGAVRSMSEIDAVGHRVVHGGEYFNESVVVDDKVISAIEECIPLAPLHNPPNLIGIRACSEILGSVPQVAVFDTAFHQTMPQMAYLYSLPYKYYEHMKVRRYGFHGTSHRYVACRAAEILGRDLSGLKLITCHMGNGSSLAAVKEGSSIDTSMGFTPLEGVPMGTRSGNIDPAIIKFIMEKDDITIDEVDKILNKKSGVLGISGVSSDFRDLDQAVENGNERARAALDVFCYSVKKYIGAYAAAMAGCDALIFTAGVGENNILIRERIASGLAYMGLELDEDKNRSANGECVISSGNSPGKILVIPTNEELVIATDTQRLATN
ncbi:MAG: acetate kinase [Oscillospiraceae bacterium]|nr:acetate kinase [Oscillospiraceae bacterium]